MKLCKVQSKVLDAALKDREISALSLYLGSFQRTEDGCFVCQVVDYDGKPTPDIRLAIFDYTFNEPESKKIWDIAKATIGKATIDLKVLTIVNL